MTGEQGQTFTARSVVASVLLGSEPPVMPAKALVRVGSLFGLAAGTVRTALSRMVANNELQRRDDGRYELKGHLLDRHVRQRTSRQPEMRKWGGYWEMWVVGNVARTAVQRSDFRTAAQSLRLVELRDGVWLRPDNLDPFRLEGARNHLVGQARRFTTLPDHDTVLVEELWNLHTWSSSALELRREMAGLLARLVANDVTALQPGFVVAATVLRHLNQDPQLPAELLPRDWQGERLRGDYEAYDLEYSALLRRWLQSGSAVTVRW